MANSSPSSFWTQADALLRKNLTYQKRNMRANIRLVLIPAVLISMLAFAQNQLDGINKIPEAKCGCICANNTSGKQCPKLCGVKYSNDPTQASLCEIPKPPEWPPLLQLDGQAASNKMLFTAQNRSFAQSVSGNMFPNASTTSPSDSRKDSLDSLDTLATYVLGTSAEPAGEMGGYNFFEPGVQTGSVIDLQTQCRNDSSGSFRISGLPKPIDLEATCSEAILLWRNSSSEINNELFKFISSSKKENEPFKPGITDSIVSAFDFLNSNGNRFNVTIWYDKGLGSAVSLIRIPRYVNLISNAYLQFLRGPGTKMLFEFVKEMPKHETSFDLQEITEPIAVIEGLLFTWVILLLFPVIVTTLVYEKQQKLRIIMKMHGLGDGPYWTISYAYFLAISMIYMLYFVIYGSILRLKFFTLNDYSIQFVFYIVYINLQISSGFLMASLFSNVKTAAVTAYIGLFGTGLVASFLFRNFIEDNSFPSKLND